jgi:hypothetical protein
MPYDGRYFFRTSAATQVERVMEVIATEDMWCKNRLATADGRHCLRGALRAAGATYRVDRMLMRTIRQVTGQRLTIEAFNDNDHTTHASVLNILNSARDQALAAETQGLGARLGYWLRR